MFKQQRAGVRIDLVARVLTNIARVSVLVLMAPALFAQGAAPVERGPVPPDFSTVVIKTNKISDKFYTLEGQGGTIGVLIGPDGVFMVDTQFAPLSEKIAAAIKQLTPKPIRYVVNTHVHGDHTGGNVNFATMGATIISREELRYRLAHPNPQPNGQPGVPTAPIGLPKLTYGNRLTLYLNGEEVQIIAVPRAHTDGDTLVCFPGLDVIMPGDFYRSIQYPNIDRNNGGTLAGLLDGLGTLIGRAGPATKIIPGHGPTVDRTAVIVHRDMVLTLRDRIAALVAQGKTEEEVVSAKVTADFDERIQQPGTTAERFVRQVYAELKAAQ
jgi:glyoxylase-like metal-dependent hydrolase (beta-lactamase superfamily II)